MASLCINWDNFLWHFLPFWTNLAMVILLGPFCYNVGQFFAILYHTTSLLTILWHFGTIWAPPCHFGPFVFFYNFRQFFSFSTILHHFNHFGPFYDFSQQFGPIWTILRHFGPSLGLLIPFCGHIRPDSRDISGPILGTGTCSASSSSSSPISTSIVHTTFLPLPPSPSTDHFLPTQLVSSDDDGMTTIVSLAYLLMHSLANKWWGTKSI